ncbi:hypothetical protein B0T24DRAFT_715635 [Lasiosphaeria ovina]|uniref:RRM domain-containing protein n=1 Tax=Lasiosphaeria ovina TaxID=92902 RepID=A0AAE0TY48_9PEZI|nr:hypothetical protein B0T24DRAFT_715635 [Lasiosphaeria ovina]
MDPGLDRSLDEILAERKQNGGGGGGRGPRGGRGNSSNAGGGGGGGAGGGRRRERQDYPRDGVRKSYRDDAPRNLDTEWVHDRFEDNVGNRRSQRRRHSPDPSSDSRGSKIRVDNIHYELTQEDLEGLFSRIGPIVKLDIKYDRAGRSEGTAFVTYESNSDATKAIREYNGANAAGQPIRLTLMPTGPRRNPFDSAVVPGRSLAERITVPAGRSRSLSPRRESDEEAARKGTDRYRPAAKASRSRSPLPARRGPRDGGGRRPGARREGGGDRGSERGRRGGGGGERGGDRTREGRDGRPRKTQEELDAEMEDYFGGGAAQQADAGPAAGSSGNAAGARAPVEDDVDMIE